MKKLFSLLLAMMLVCAYIPAMAEETPEGYPEVVPGIDLGGQTVYIYDYWTSGTSDDHVPDPTAEQQAQYDYRDWLMETYNCHIVQLADGDWGSNATQLTNFFAAPDGSLRVYILPPDFVGGPMANNAFADWSKLSTIDLTDTEKADWNQATINFMTKGDAVYGVSKGNNEPRSCLYFNKRVLEESDIDWETIYDMQAEGTWTWDVFEDMLAKIQKDKDNDGIVDIWGLTGSNVDLYVTAVYGNGGHFFSFNDAGEITVTAGSSEVLDALTWSKRIWETYGYQQPADGAWDYYKDAWKQGFCGFYIYQCYGGFNDNSEMSDMDDEWGCVAVPVKEAGMPYVTTVSENTTVIPNVYDEETTAKIAFIYDMWSRATPGYDDEFAWIGNKYDYTDDRAVDETYAMLRESDHGVSHDCLYLGSLNDVLGDGFLWELVNSTPAELVETNMGKWQGLCDIFNGKTPAPTEAPAEEAPAA